MSDVHGTVSGARHRPRTCASQDAPMPPMNTQGSSAATGFSTPRGHTAARIHLTIPVLHFVASFFASTVLPPDLRHLRDPASTLPTEATAATTATDADTSSAAVQARMSARPLHHPALPLPASVVQKTLQEEKPPISMPLAFIAANPACRRAQELHGCVLPPQGGLVLRLLAPESLFPTPESQLSATTTYTANAPLAHGRGGGDGGRRAGVGGSDAAGQGLTTGSLLDSLYYTKRGHWVYDSRGTHGGTAAQRRRRLQQAPLTTHSRDSAVPLTSSALAVPPAVLVVVSRNNNGAAGSPLVHSPIAPRPTAAPPGLPPPPLSPTTRARALPSAGTSPGASSDTPSPLRRSPGLLPVYGPRTGSASLARLPPALAPRAETATTVSTAVGMAATDDGAALSPAMQALALAAWWLHRRPSLPLSLSLQGYSAEQTMQMMALLTEADAPAPDEADDADHASEGEAEETVVVKHAWTRDVAPKPRIPAVWSAHSLHSSHHDSTAPVHSDDDDNGTWAQGVAQAATATAIHDNSNVTHAQRAVSHPARPDMTEITIRAAGGGWRSSGSGAVDPSLPSAQEALAGSDSRALALLLTKYPELRSISLHNSNLTGEELSNLSHECQHITHLSLGMNPALRTTRFLAPSTTSTRTSLTTATHTTRGPEAVRPTDAFGADHAVPTASAPPVAAQLFEPEEAPEHHGDALVANGNVDGVGQLSPPPQGDGDNYSGEVAVLPHAVSATSVPSTSRSLSFSLNQNEAAALRDALLSPRERRQLALVVRPADVHMGSVRRGVGNLREDDRYTVTTQRGVVPGVAGRQHGAWREDEQLGALTSVLSPNWLGEAETETEASMATPRRTAHHVDPDALLHELRASPARRDVAEEVRRLVVADGAYAHHDVPAFAESAEPEPFRTPIATPQGHPGRSRRDQHTDPSPARRGPRRRPNWSSTLLELDLSYTAVHTADAARYLPRLTQLHVLSLEGCREMTALEWVPTLPSLQELNLSRCDGLTPRSLWPLRACARLARLSLARLSMLQNIEWLLAPPPDAAEDAGDAADGAGAAAADRLPPPPPAPALDRVAVVGAERFLRREVDGGATAYTLLPRASTAPLPSTTTAESAVEATGTGSPSTATPVCALYPLTRGLTQLDLAFTGITRDGLTSIGRLMCLTSLSLHGCRALVDFTHGGQPLPLNRVPPHRVEGGEVQARTVGDALVSLRWLSALDLSETGVRDTTLTALVPLLRSTLHTLVLAGCRDLTHPPAWLTDRDCVKPRMTGDAPDGPEEIGLHALEMPDCPSLTAEAFAEGCLFSSRTDARGDAPREGVVAACDTTSHANGVRHVRLRGCDRVRDVRGLAPLCWVTELDLYHTAVTSDVVVPALRSWRCLQTLILASTAVSDFSGWCPTTTTPEARDSDSVVDTESGAAASVSPSLHSQAPLFLRTLRHLDLSNTPVVSSGLLFIAQCPVLRSLSLRRCACLTHLHFLPLAAPPDGMMTATAARRTALHELVVSDVRRLSADALRVVGDCAVRLNKLVLSNCCAESPLETAALATLVRTTLHELDLSGTLTQQSQVIMLLGLSPALGVEAASPLAAAARSGPPSEPTTPPLGARSPRRLTLSATTTAPLTECTTSSSSTSTSTCLAAAVSSSSSPRTAPPPLQVLRLRGGPPLSAALRSLLTPSSLRSLGFVQLDKVLL